MCLCFVGASEQLQLSSPMKSRRFTMLHPSPRTNWLRKYWTSYSYLRTVFTAVGLFLSYHLNKKYLNCLYSESKKKISQRFLDDLWLLLWQFLHADDSMNIYLTLKEPPLNFAASYLQIQYYDCFKSFYYLSKNIIIMWIKKKVKFSRTQRFSGNSRLTYQSFTKMMSWVTMTLQALSIVGVTGRCLSIFHR